MKNESDDISRKWQLGHLKYYFGLKRASESLGGKSELISKDGRCDEVDSLEPRRDFLIGTEPVQPKLAKA